MNGLPIASRALGDTPTFSRNVSLTAASVAVQAGLLPQSVANILGSSSFALYGRNITTYLGHALDGADIAVAAQDGMNAFVGVSLKSSAVVINGILRAPLMASAVAIKPQALPQAISDVLASASMAVSGQGTTSTFQDNVGLASIAINAKYLVIGAGALLEPAKVAVAARAATSLIRDNVAVRHIAVAGREAPQHVTISLAASASVAVDGADMATTISSPLARNQVAFSAKVLRPGFSAPLGAAGIAIPGKYLATKISQPLDRQKIATRARVLPGFLQHPLGKAGVAIVARTASTKLNQPLNRQQIAIRARAAPQVVRGNLVHNQIAFEPHSGFNHVFSVEMASSASVAIAAQRGGSWILHIDPAQKWRILTIHDAGRAIVVPPELRR